MILRGGHKGQAVPPNEGMKLSKPEYLGGTGQGRVAFIESGFAAYAQCSTTSREIARGVRFGFNRTDPFSRQV